MPLTHSLRRRIGMITLGVMASVLLWPVAAEAQTAAVLYQRATTREAAARKQPTTANVRAAVSAYEQIVLRHPTSGYCDDALWNGAEMARFGWERFKQESDRKTSERLYAWLRREYPTSAKAKLVATQLAALKATPAPARAAAAPPAPRPMPTPTPATPAVVDAPPANAPSMSAAPTGPLASIRRVSVAPLPRGDRLIIELDREVLFTSERIMNPERVFFDLKHVDFPAQVQSVVDNLSGSRLRTVRLGRPDGQTARVVLEVTPTATHSVYQMYHPYRLVIDLESDVAPAAPSSKPPASLTSGPAAPAAATTTTPAPPTSTPPIAPAGTPSIGPASTTSGGDYTLARQLGLGVSRIVIDPGHGGNDPGAKAHGVEEAALVLDIALRVEKLLKQQPGMDVILTRRTDEFIPLEERTAIANRQGADLFLSIHANAARRATAKGVETYFLNFATNPEAEAVAARENATSGKSMGNLPKLVQQITLNAKVKESREFAQMVQTSMIRGLRTQNKTVTDLGVKQAPFVVLIGAEMPSVLAEISFVTNKAEATLLKNEAYKQRIAQSLAEAVLKYQASLKKISTVAVAK
jgi:N-acetylmuramoyl-L-alanine amidase